MIFFYLQTVLTNSCVDDSPRFDSMLPLLDAYITHVTENEGTDPHRGIRQSSQRASSLNIKFEHVV